ncbi:MAG: helix-turn-helix transcriptional regulator [Anaerolineae bacterium]|nr:helix-turn-helix transcriptional regulator [Anaerolineae bacterium]
MEHVPESLLATKLSIPIIRPQLVPRLPLQSRLKQAVSYPLTLIIAPPGFGKTTLAVQWVQALPTSTAAWLTVDSDDNEPTRFLAYLIASLKVAYPDLGVGAQQLLESPRPVPPRAMIASLINDIVGLRQAVCLVIDDYHVITEPAIHDALAYLLDNVPNNFHLLLVGRSDPPLPLPRYRARGQLTEFRVADLRFTLDEAVTFFESLEITLTKDDVSRLESRTEGWVAGLQLTALSLTGRDESYNRRFVQAFTGSHRHILDYLADEVLEHQPQQVQAFLLETSILDRLAALLCDAVTGRSDGKAMLAYLEQANLFVVPLDEERQWYRYHHLFADVLRHRLRMQQPELPPVLHMRASQWYEQHHLYGEAITHALAAQDVERAAGLLEVASRDFWTRREMSMIHSWLRLLPEPEVRHRLRLTLVDAQLHLFQGHMAIVERRIRDAQQTLAQHPQSDPLLHNELIALQSMAENLMRGGSDGLQLATQAAEHLPPEHPLRGTALLNIGIAHWLRGDLDPAEAALLRTKDVCLDVGNTYQAQVAMAYQGQIQWMRGLLLEAETTYRTALDLTPERWDIPDINGLFVGLGAIQYEQNDLAAAEQNLEHGTALARQEENALVIIGGLTWQAFAANAKHDLPRARQLVAEAAQIAEKAKIDWVWVAPSLAAQWSQLALLQGDLAAARRWLVGIDSRKNDAPPLQREAEQVALARLATAEDRPDEARLILEPLLENARKHRQNLSVIRASILLALALRNNTERAFSLLEQALEMAEPEGFVRLFVDEGEPLRLLLEQLVNRRESSIRTYAGLLLRACSRVTAASMPAAKQLPEPLSAREMEVLRLLSEGHSSNEIAQKLIISVETARKHIKNIYGKLDVHSQFEAIRRAQELDLI